MKPLISIVTFFFTVLLLQSAQAQEVVIHSSVRQTEISRNVLRAIFGMRLRKWPNGLPITVFVLPDHDPHHIQFSKSTLHVFPYQLRRAWDRQVFSGTGQSPQEVSSLKEMAEIIAATPGGIGYLVIENLDETRASRPLEVLHVR